MIEAKAVSLDRLPTWIAARLRLQQQSADETTLEFIANKVEGNLLAAFQEVQKLALLFPPGAISFEQIREAVLDVARYDVFSLGETLLEGDAVRLTRMVEGLQGEGAAPPMALWAVAEEIRAIGRVLDAASSGRPLNQVMREARVFGAAHQNLMQQNIGRFRAAHVTRGLRHAAAIDRMVKGLARGDVWDELLRLMLGFARKPAARSAA